MRSNTRQDWNSCRWFICLSVGVLLAACGTETGGEADGSAVDAGGALPDIGFGDVGSADLGGTTTDSGEAPTEDAAVEGDVVDDAPTDSCPGGPGCDCVQSSDCDNNFCIDVPQGKRCAVKCVDDCDDGFSCAPVSAGGGDVVTICVPTGLRLCDPCTDSKACKSLGVDDAACVDQGSAGAFCGVGCKTSEQCAKGFECKAVTTIEGASSNMCVPKPGADGAATDCTCSQAATDAKLTTKCFVEHFTDDKQLAGKCPGVRTCGESGLSACTAPPLEVEVCDGKDNDCDGKVDEDTCTDDNDCTQGACDPAKGCLVNKLDKVPCDADGDVCTENDACKEGVCVPGTPKKCDDGNPCTIAACDLAKGCTQTADDGKPCDADGTACTVGDICSSGVCSVGKVVSCDDSNACTKDACDDKTGKCAYKPLVDGVACDDGTACTIADSCTAGSCGGKKLVCDDANACTANTCDPKTGCKKTTLDGAACDDDNPCTIGDLCKADQCAAGKVKICDAGDPCVTGKCKITTGKCNWQDKSDGESCDDGSACTSSDACKGGNCGGKQINCDDKNACTSDSCDKVAGCKHKPISQSCSDGNACTESDACVQGKCVGKAVGPAKCEDGNPCTDDGCAPKTGCTNVANSKPCSDGDSCTDGDLCANGKCKAGKDICQCQKDSDCAAKDDGNLCNGIQYCDKSKPAHVCKPKPNSAVLCDTKGDGPCAKTSCVAKTGQCIKTSATDGSGCDADGSVCTQGDACAGGLCKVGKPLPCSDGNVCTNDLCDKAKGCYKVNNSQPCNDGNACTSKDGCSGGSCAGTPLVVAVSCNDNNPCTTDACSPKLGCTYAPNQNKCDDGKPCTKGDVCAGSKCVPGTNICECNVNSDCAGKEDGNLCNGTLFCDKSQAPFSCKINPLTIVFCNTSGDGPCKKTACVNKTGKCLQQAAANGKACDADGSVCTKSDACSGGACKPGAPLNCNDGKVCTDDLCDKAKGCYTVNSNKGCDDNNKCTSGDTCKAGKCTANPVNCNDNNPCTEDLCDASSGCKLIPNASPCNDGNACTKNDKCSSGKCGGDQLSCNDNNPCTTDTCNTSKGCQTTPVNDKTPCGGGKICLSGKCQSACSNGSKIFNYSGSATNFNVPSCVQTLTIEAWGAEAGTKKSKGGRGAMMRGSFTGLGGKSLRVVVGGRGKDGTCGLCGGGGGGGSFISNNSNGQPLLIASGGGGSSYQGHAGQGGLTSQKGGPGGYSSVGIGQGGYSNNGGGGGTGAGGGGWNGDGTGNNWAKGGKKKGGAGGTTSYSGKGGFGGGGASYHGGGGGGGYTGGSGGTYSKGGGGGGSYCSGSLIGSQGNVRTGNGEVRFSW